MLKPARFELDWRTDTPTKEIKHALVQLQGGDVAPGRWSDVSKTWQAWTGAEYVAVWPEGWVDLSLIETGGVPCGAVPSVAGAPMDEDEN